MDVNQTAPVASESITTPVLRGRNAISPANSDPLAQHLATNHQGEALPRWHNLAGILRLESSEKLIHVKGIVAT